MNGTGLSQIGGTPQYIQPSWVTIDEGDRLGIVFASDDGGTEIVYLMRNLEDRVLKVLPGAADIA
jgi:hypothetical protein